MNTAVTAPSGAVATGEFMLRKQPDGGEAYRILVALSHVDGVRSAEVRIRDGRVRVGYDPRTSLESLAAAVRAAGFRLRKPEEDARLAA